MEYCAGMSKDDVYEADALKELGAGQKETSKKNPRDLGPTAGLREIALNYAPSSIAPPSVRCADPSLRECHPAHSHSITHPKIGRDRSLRIKWMLMLGETS